MRGNFKFELLRAETADSVSMVIAKVYAQSYSRLALPSAAEAWASHCRGDELVALAFSGEEAVGMISLKRLPGNPRLYELGMLSVVKEHRGSDAVAGLLDFAGREFPRMADCDAVVMENVSSHYYSQRKAARRGGVDCAIALSALPSLTGGERLSHILSFMEQPGAQPQPVHIPEIYAPLFALFYTDLRARGFIFAPSHSRPTGASGFLTRRFPTLSLLKIDCLTIGQDFADKAREMVADDRETIQINLPLDSPHVGFAAACLRRQGFFLGGVLPFWFGGDALMLQKILPDNAGRMCLYSEKARKMLAVIERDRRNNQLHYD